MQVLRLVLKPYTFLNNNIVIIDLANNKFFKDEQNPFLNEVQQYSTILYA